MPPGETGEEGYACQVVVVVMVVVVVVERSKGRVCPTLPCYELVWDTYWGVVSGCVCVWRGGGCLFFFFSSFFSSFFSLSGCAGEWRGCVSVYFFLPFFIYNFYNFSFGKFLLFIY